MDVFYTLLKSIFILVGLILIAFWLKSRSVISNDNKVLFSRLVTDFALPALIFSSLAARSFSFWELMPSLIMFCAIVFCCFLSWLLGKALKLESSKLGALVLACGFGSSATLGYALINQVYCNNSGAMRDALLIGEIGVGLPIFTMGAAIAIYFGKKKGVTVWSATLAFFSSPIFISLIAGLICSLIGLPLKNPAIEVILKILSIIGNALIIFVAITIALMLRPIKVKEMLPLIIIVVIMKLIAEPLLAYEGSLIFGTIDPAKEILFLEASMPSGTIAAVLAERYGCDGGTASALIIATYVLSLITIPLIFYFVM